MKENLHQAGYDKEAEYFHKLNQDLIAKKRQTLESQKEETAQKHSQEAYWMVCPKCGSKMAEKDYLGIKIDECSGCKGVYFDAGELDIILESKEAKGFFGFLRSKR